MDKAELRRHIRRLKNVYTAEQLGVFSESVCREVMSLPLWQKSRVVLLYYALPDEVDTHLLVERAIKDGKQVLLPVVVGDDLILRQYQSDVDLTVGAYGILEPNGPLYTEYSSIDLAIIPGMAFDKDGHRLGRGKGYYDRLLPRISAFKMGICFPFQLVENVPFESHDVAMDGICPTIS